MILIKEISAAINRASMKLLSFVFIILISWMSVSGQNTQKKISKSDGTILLKVTDVFGEHQFYVDIKFNGRYAKIMCTYTDSIRFSDVRKDVEFSKLTLETAKYKLYEQQPKWLIDSLTRIFEMHSTYTRDSASINLRKDKEYAKLLERFCNATKDELAPNIKRTWTDGYSITISITNDQKKLIVYADTPDSTNHPLLMSMVAQTLEKCKGSNAVKKILNFHVEFKR